MKNVTAFMRSFSYCPAIVTEFLGGLMASLASLGISGTDIYTRPPKPGNVQ